MATTVTSKGQVTIPKSVRDHLGIRPGSRVDFRQAADGRHREGGRSAAVEQLPLLTRDGRRYKTYFPTIELITPEG